MVTLLRRLGLVAVLTWWVAVAATAAPVIFTAWARSYFTRPYGAGLVPLTVRRHTGGLCAAHDRPGGDAHGPVILLFRSELLDTLRSSFARFAVASGHSELRIVAVHAAKASAGP